MKTEIARTINNFLNVNKGIWSFSPGYSLGRIGNTIAVRIDLAYVKKEKGNKILAIDVDTKKEKIAIAFISEGSVNTITHEDTIREGLAEFNSKYEECMSNGIGLINVKKFFDN